MKRKLWLFFGFWFVVSCSEPIVSDDVETDKDTEIDTGSDTGTIDSEEVDFCESLLDCFTLYCKEYEADTDDDMLTTCVNFCYTYAFADYLNYVQAESIEYDSESDDQCLFVAASYEEAPAEAQAENNFIESCVENSLTPNECASSYEESGPGKMDLWMDTVEDYCLPLCSF